MHSCGGEGSSVACCRTGQVADAPKLSLLGPTSEAMAAPSRRLADVWLAGRSPFALLAEVSTLGDAHHSVSSGNSVMLVACLVGFPRDS